MGKISKSFLLFYLLFCIPRLGQVRDLQSGTSNSAGKSLFAVSDVLASLLGNFAHRALSEYGHGEDVFLLYCPIYSRIRNWGPGSRLVRGASRAAPGLGGTQHPFRPRGRICVVGWLFSAPEAYLCPSDRRGWRPARIQASRAGGTGTGARVQGRSRRPQAGPGLYGPYRHALARRPPRKARPFVRRRQPASLLKCELSVLACIIRRPWDGMVLVTK